MIRSSLYSDMVECGPGSGPKEKLDGAKALGATSGMRCSSCVLAHRVMRRFFLGRE